MRRDYYLGPLICVFHLLQCYTQLDLGHAIWNTCRLAYLNLLLGGHLLRKDLCVVGQLIRGCCFCSILDDGLRISVLHVQSGRKVAKSTYSTNIVPAPLSHSCCEEAIPQILAALLCSLEACCTLPCLYTLKTYGIDVSELGIRPDCRFHCESVDIFKQQVILQRRLVLTNIPQRLQDGIRLKLQLQRNIGPPCLRNVRSAVT